MSISDTNGEKKGGARLCTHSERSANRTLPQTARSMVHVGIRVRSTERRKKCDTRMNHLLQVVMASDDLWLFSRRGLGQFRILMVGSDPA